MGKVPDAAEELHHHVADVLPIGGEHRDQRTQMEQYVEKFRHAACALQAQQVLCDSQVAGAGDGQELRHALYQSQQE